MGKNSKFIRRQRLSRAMWLNLVMPVFYKSVMSVPPIQNSFLRFVFFFFFKKLDNSFLN